MKTPYIAALVVAGLIAGAIAPGLSAGVFPFVTLYVLLPALIFEGAWQLDRATLRKVWRPVLLLSVPGVAVTAAIVAVAANVWGGLALPAALLLGAILSATDPVAVIAVFRRLAIPKSLATIVEAESLLNDGVAVLLYRAILLAATAGLSLGSFDRLALGAIVGVVMGIACGCAVGSLARAVTRKGGAASVLATVAAAYGSYALAGTFAWSGIFAVIACAIVLRAAFEREESARDDIERLWSVLSTAANVVLFFGIGAAVALPGFARSWPAIVAASIAVAIARFVLSYGLLAVVPGLRGSWRAVIGLAGLRGALALALALSLPLGVPGRGTIVDVTFAVVVITLVVSALSYERGMRRIDFS